MRFWLYLYCLFYLCGCQVFSTQETIAVLLPKDEGDAKKNREMLNALMLTSETVNQAGGIRGRPLELLIETTPNTPEDLNKISQNWKNQKIKAVIAAGDKQVLNRLLSNFKATQIPIIFPAALTRSELIQGQGTIFSIMGSREAEAEVASHYIFAAGFQRIAIVYETAYEDIARLRQKFLQKIMSTPSLSLKFDRNDHPEILLEAFSQQAPDLIYYAGSYQGAAQLRDLLKRQNLELPLLGDHKLDDPEFIRHAGLNLASNTLVVSQDTQENLEFKQALENRFGESGPMAYYTHDALQILIQVLNSPSSENTSLKAKLNSLTYPGLTGPIAFNHFGENIRAQFQVWQINAEGGFLPARLPSPRWQNAGKTLALYSKIPNKKAP